MNNLICAFSVLFAPKPYIESRQGPEADLTPTSRNSKAEDELAVDSCIRRHAWKSWLEELPFCSSQ